MLRKLFKLLPIEVVYEVLWWHTDAWETWSDHYSMKDATEDYNRSKQLYCHTFCIERQIRWLTRYHDKT